MESGERAEEERMLGTKEKGGLATNATKAYSSYSSWSTFCTHKHSYTRTNERTQSFIARYFRKVPQLPGASLSQCCLPLCVFRQPALGMCLVMATSRRKVSIPTAMLDASHSREHGTFTFRYRKALSISSLFIHLSQPIPTQSSRCASATTLHPSSPTHPSSLLAYS